MTQTIEFKISYDGQALQNHSMDVRDLAPSLLALGKLFDEANHILNGEKTSVKLQVRAHELGSFEILFELYQSLGNQLSHFLTSDFVISALNLKELILTGTAGVVSLFALIKKLKGKNPDKLTDLGNGMIRIETANEKIDIPLNLLRLYQDVAVRQATEEILRPLEKEGIEYFKIKEKNKIVEIIAKEELNSFITPELPDEKIVVSETEAAYSIVSLAFKEDNKWRLHDGNSTISVTISDSEFKEKVDHNVISFAKNDILRCKIKVTQWKTSAGLKTDYEVLKVIEHIPAAKQLLLFDAP